MTAKVLAWLIFGLIGMAAFGYGRKQGRLKVLVIAGLLMIYPYFVDGAWALWLIGLGLTAALFVFPD